MGTHPRVSQYIAESPVKGLGLQGADTEADGGSGFQERPQECRERRALKAPRRDVDAGQDDLPYTTLFHVAGALHGLLQRKTHRAAARLRDPAVRAGTVATILHLEEGARAKALGDRGKGEGVRGPCGSEQAQPLSVHRATFAEGPPELENGSFAGLGDHDDVGGQGLDAFPLHLRGAARDHEERRGARARKGPDVRPYLVVRL